MPAGSPAPRRRTHGAGALQEALRVVGLSLETTDVRRANFQIDAQGVCVRTTTSYGVRTFTWEDLASQERALRAQRKSSRPTYADPWSLGRWSVLLRGAGALLDAGGIDTCELAATVGQDAEAGGSTLRAFVDGRNVFSEVDVGEQILRLRLRHDNRNYPQASQPSRERRGWWPFRKGD